MLDQGISPEKKETVGNGTCLGSSSVFVLVSIERGFGEGRRVREEEPISLNRLPL